MTTEPDLEGFLDGKLFPLLPDNLVPYDHQVGGHGTTNKSGRCGSMLRAPDKGIIYKKLQSGARGRREGQFYQQVFDEKAPPNVVDLRSVVPTYLGLYRSHEGGADVYLALEDVLSELKNPSVCDIKMGRVGCPPDAGEAKINSEKAKYEHRDSVGFLFTGMRIYKKASGRILSVPRLYGRSLDLEAVYTKAILPFLQEDANLSATFLSQLTKIKDVLASCPFVFYSSSILLAYDDKRDRAVVKLVDFAHWRPSSSFESSSEAAKDPSGVLYGVENLLDMLSAAILNNPPTASDLSCIPFIEL